MEDFALWIKFVQRWFNKRTRDIMQGANADDCIPSWGINFILLNKTTFIAQSRYQIWPLVVTSGDYQRSDRARFLLTRRNAKVATTKATKRIRVPFVAFCNIIAGHSFTQSGLKWALYAFFFLAFPTHGDPLRLDAIAVFCIIHSSGL